MKQQTLDRQNIATVYLFAYARIPELTGSFIARGDSDSSKALKPFATSFIEGRRSRFINEEHEE
jgi:hypothetical protein